MNYQQVPECMPGCRSRKHASLVQAAIVRGTAEEALAYMKLICHRSYHVVDEAGRSALHMAASCGKSKVVKWLLAKGVLPTQRDWESGYTSVHRSIFYGNLDIATVLCAAGGSLTSVDHDGLTPLDHLIRDRPAYIEYQPTLPSEVYSWGTNSNFTLGQASQQARDMPGLVDFPMKKTDTIRSFSMSKFHSIFLSLSGHVYVCGHGHGGRLGIDTEAPVISPRLVKALVQTCVTMVAAAVDHSLFLVDSGQVWSCGTNTYHQLGHNPPPEVVTTPRCLAWFKTHKDECIVGIGTARYHSVMWTRRILYSFGLNAGQLGHHRAANERTVVSPRAVTSIVLKEGGEILCTGVCDAATVIVTSLGDIYVLHQYQTRKVASKMQGVVKVACEGGHLDTRVDVNGIREKGGSELKILVLLSSGFLFLWSEQFPYLRQCFFNLNREILIKDFSLNHRNIGFVSDRGEAFIGYILPQKQRKSSQKTNTLSKITSGLLVDFSDHNMCHTIKLNRLNALHRAVAIASEPEGCNFICLQNDPKCFLPESVKPKVTPSQLEADYALLLEETSLLDFIHDVILDVGKRHFPVHSYIIAMHSDQLRKDLMAQSIEKNTEGIEEPHFYLGCDSPESKYIIKLPNTSPEIFQEILCYMYKGTCQFLAPGPLSPNLRAEESRLSAGNENCAPCVDNTILNDLVDTQGQSAYSVYKEEEKVVKRLNKKKKKAKKGKVPETTEEKDLVRRAETVALSLGMSSLAKQLANYKVQDGCVLVKNASVVRPDMVNFMQYKRNHLTDLWDVMIETEDGEMVGAHKCILAARLEYFRIMFGAGWNETSSSSELTMPIHSSVLTVILDYLYEDDATKLQSSSDVEFVCNVLALANQLLIMRLKTTCEFILTNLLTLKNVVEILEFASIHNATQLKVACMEMIAQNLPSLLEIGLLNSLSSAVLQDLSNYYKKFVPKMSYRIITPYDSPPYPEDLQQALLENPMSLPDMDMDWTEEVKADEEAGVKITGSSSGSNLNSSGKKKKRTHKNSIGTYRSMRESVSSQLSFASSTSEGDLSKDLEDDLEELSFDSLEERSPCATPSDKDDFSKEMDNNGKWQKVGKKEHGITAQDNEPIASMENLKNTFQKKMVLEIQTNDLKIVPSSSSHHSVQKEEYPTLAATHTLDLSVATKAKVLQKGSGKNNKLSQKQRKKLAAESAQASPPKENGHVTPTSPWGCSSLVTSIQGPAKSLVDIMKAEQEVIGSRESTVSKRFPSSKKCLVDPQKSQPISITGKRGWATVERPGESSSAEAAGQFAASPETPKSFPSSIPSEGLSSIPSFSHILKEEEKHTENYMRERSKPLSLIQLEDHAIEELNKFYGAFECFEEVIEVKRVAKRLCNPIWSNNRGPKDT
ncbi:inhibitor of Bruton tyrosine kinase isoform X2 [Oratosquilla oratoria]|uniref:inhibitor of Bruton tyrosine kinase isoform X2 n=1 Tax=Oratosquilla oratoria TaxID=337810 RepID=UPI003F776253